MVKVLTPLDSAEAIHAFAEEEGLLDRVDDILDPGSALIETARFYPEGSLAEQVSAMDVLCLSLRAYFSRETARAAFESQSTSLRGLSEFLSPEEFRKKVMREAFPTLSFMAAGIRRECPDEEGWYDFLLDLIEKNPMYGIGGVSYAMKVMLDQVQPDQREAVQAIFQAKYRFPEQITDEDDPRPEEGINRRFVVRGLGEWIQPRDFIELLADCFPTRQFQVARMEHFLPTVATRYDKLLELIYDRVSPDQGILRVFNALIEKVGEQHRANILALFQEKFPLIVFPEPQRQARTDGPRERIENMDASMAHIVFEVMQARERVFEVSEYMPLTLEMVEPTLRGLGYVPNVEEIPADRQWETVRKLHIGVSEVAMQREELLKAKEIVQGVLATMAPQRGRRGRRGRPRSFDFMRGIYSDAVLEEARRILKDEHDLEVEARRSGDHWCFTAYPTQRL